MRGPAARSCRAWRTAAAGALGVLLLLGLLRGTVPAVRAADPLILQAQPVPLSAGDPDVVRVGRLEYRGGLELTSPDRRFGGLSDVRVAVDGSRFVAVSDDGWLIRGRLRYDAAGRLASVAREAEIEDLRGPDGRTLYGKYERDAEALVALPDGRMIVSFERQNWLWQYTPGKPWPTPLPQPPFINEAPFNEGIETLTRLADGRLLAISEGLATDKGVMGWIGGMGGWETLDWRIGFGFRPTSATTLPSGDVLVLERMSFPPAARVRLVHSADFRPGTVLDGEEIARLDGGLTFDNMEGIDTRQDARGDLLVYMVSDQNYRRLQRTLLLMFRFGD